MSKSDAEMHSYGQIPANGQRRFRSRRFQHGRVGGGTILVIIILLLPISKTIKMAAERAQTTPSETHAAVVEAAAPTATESHWLQPKTDWALLVPHKALYKGPAQLDGGLYEVRAMFRFERDCEKWQSALVMSFEPEETQRDEISSFKSAVYVDEWLDGSRYVEIASTMVGEEKVYWRKIDVARRVDGTSSGVLETWDIEREEPWDKGPVTLPAGVKFFHENIVLTLEAIRTGEPRLEVLAIDTDEEGLIGRELSEIREYRPASALDEDPPLWLVKTTFFPVNGPSEPTLEEFAAMTADGFTRRARVIAEGMDIELGSIHYESMEELMPFPCPASTGGANEPRD